MCSFVRDFFAKVYFNDVTWRYTPQVRGSLYSTQRDELKDSIGFHREHTASASELDSTRRRTSRNVA